MCIRDSVVAEANTLANTLILNAKTALDTSLKDAQSLDSDVYKRQELTLKSLSVLDTKMQKSLVYM